MSNQSKLGKLSQAEQAVADKHGPNKPSAASSSESSADIDEESSSKSNKN